MDNNITGWFTTEDGVHVPIRDGQSKAEAIKERFPKNQPLNKKDAFFDRIQKQTGVDLKQYQETGHGLDKKRKYVSIHLEDATPVERQKVLDFIVKKGIRHEDNGGYGHAFYV